MWSRPRSCRSASGKGVCLYYYILLAITLVLQNNYHLCLSPYNRNPFIQIWKLTALSRRHLWWQVYLKLLTRFWISRKWRCYHINTAHSWPIGPWCIWRVWIYSQMDIFKDLKSEHQCLTFLLFLGVMDERGVALDNSLSPDDLYDMIILPQTHFYGSFIYRLNLGLIPWWSHPNKNDSDQTFPT